ncbi:MAG TPA: MFS transporter [Geminicoccus sp.]|jgi:predicted MFS family arabinose efflux permease|uniref:MFS transporter n=1 Tax=Geminicoccus sp. TaxID=2024832 RepID=UPI002E31737E|nr:MFS transporter [Geminicoccus sp.]HEX2525935.1 MFS transporter [Geminicoccus sp.]
MSQPLASLAALSLAYILSQFFRTSLAVIAPEISRDLALTPQDLGFLSSVWFIAFAVMQIPVGIALDKYGIRRLVAPMVLVAAAGALLLAVAPNLQVGILAQVVIGIGCAPVYMGTLVLLTRWYDPARFASLASLVLALGSLGNLMGTAPLAWLSGLLGWRLALVIVAAIVALAAVLVWLYVQDTRDGSPAPASGEHPLRALIGTFKVARNGDLWPLMPMALIGYGVMVTMRGLWGGPYLAELFGLDAIERGNVLFLMSLGMVAGPLLYASVERRTDRRKLPVLAGSCVTLLALATLTVTENLATASVALVLIGCFGSVFNMVMAQGRRFFAPHEMGRGLTLLNGACFGGAALLQVLTGQVAATAAPPVWTAVFLTLGGLLAVAMVFLAFSRDRRLAELR